MLCRECESIFGTHVQLYYTKTNEVYLLDYSSGARDELTSTLITQESPSEQTFNLLYKWLYAEQISGDGLHPLEE